MESDLRERSLKDESGIAMALAVIMVLLIGVMGAGLLTFVSTDLNSVVETNQGQRAFEMADAGVKAAKHQLSASQTSGKYNGDPGGGDPPDNQWSLCYQKTPAACAATPAPGVTLVNLDGDGDDSDQFTVTIREIAANTFRVVSMGQYGDAKRKIEAVFSARDFAVPFAYYTSNVMNDSIDIRNSTTLHNMSVFSVGSVKMGTGIQYEGEDRLYGNWAENNNPFNSTPRQVSSPGIGVVCMIRSNAAELGTRNFDGKTGITSLSVCGDLNDSGNSYSGSKFVAAPSNPGNQSTSEITFPFDLTKVQPSADLQSEDQQRLTYLRGLAQEQGHYIEQSNLGASGIVEYNGSYKITGWPEDSDYDTTVVYIKLNPKDNGEDTKLLWNVPGSCPDPDNVDPNHDIKRGILVVENGHLDFDSSSTALFSGVTIVRGARAVTNDNSFNGSGNADCWEGPINADGETTLSGDVGFFTSNLNPTAVYGGLSGAELQSWREVYN